MKNEKTEAHFMDAQQAASKYFSMGV